MPRHTQQHTPYLILMHWLLIASLIGFGLIVAWDLAFLPDILERDNTRISLIILIVFMLGSMHCAERSFYLSRQTEVLHHSQQDPASPIQQYWQSVTDHPIDANNKTLQAELLAEKIRGQHQIGWFMAGALIKLGLLGTVIGFIIMLSSLDSIKAMDIDQVQSLMQQMTHGMGIALNTTLLGLIGSLLLGIQYLYLDRHADQLITQTLQESS